MKGWILYDIIVIQIAPVLKLLACVHQPLLIRRNSFLLLDSFLDTYDRFGLVDIKSDSLSSERFDKNLHV